MAITRANKLGSATTSLTGQSSLAMTVSATTIAHNRIIVVASWGANFTSVTPAATDSQGNSYQLDKSLGDGIGGGAAVFSGRADAPLVNGVDTITISWTGNTVGSPMMCAYEYAGLANFSPLDQAVAAKGTSVSPNSGSATTQFANELVFGAICWLATTSFSSPSYTQLDRFTGTGRSIETQEDIVAATGSFAVTGTLAPTPTWISFLVSYADTVNTTPQLLANTTTPVITGSGVVGMQLTCSQGLWSGAPTAYSYQWKRDGSNVSTGAHYLVTTTDVGHVLSCVVSASNKYGPVTATASNTVTPSTNKVQIGLGI